MKILYDGWPLIYGPNSPAALHLLGILAAHPPDVEAILALPGEPPIWLPLDGSHPVQPTANTPRAYLDWEQGILPGLLRRTGAALLHATSSNLPLFAARPVLASPAGFEEMSNGRSFWERLRLAAAQGGMRRVNGLLWPEDLPPPDTDRTVFSLPPMAYPSSTGDALPAGEIDPSELDLPESYVLYHGPSREAALRRLLSAWSWAAAPVGELYPLVALGLDTDGRERLLTLAAESGMGETVRCLPALSPQALGKVYQRSAALFHPAEEPAWGGPVRLALAHGKPVVSIESPRTNALVGPAAYLIPGEDSRLLGAALITVLVEEEIADRLTQAGEQRAAAWSMAAFGQALSSAYHKVYDR